MEKQQEDDYPKHGIAPYGPETGLPELKHRVRSSAVKARGMGMKMKSKDQGDFIEANGGGEQHTGSGGRVDGIHRRFML